MNKQIRDDFRKTSYVYEKKVDDIEAALRQLDKDSVRNEARAEAIFSSEAKPTPRQPDSISVTYRDGAIITIGATVEFFTRGRFSSSRGKLYKTSDIKELVTAKNSAGRSISRAPHNLRFINQNAEC